MKASETAEDASEHRTGPKSPTGTIIMPLLMPMGGPSPMGRCMARSENKPRNSAAPLLSCGHLLTLYFPLHLLLDVVLSHSRHAPPVGPRREGSKDASDDAV